MNQQSLNNLQFLNTRPEAQAKNLSEKIYRLGGRCISLPTIIISPIETHCEKYLNQLSNYDYAIFLSANAANIMLPKWPAHYSTKIIAIGFGTARAIKQFNIKVDYVPETMTSEGLLALPIFTAPRLKKIIIFCGENNRPLLPMELEKRGAAVELCACYRRQCPKLLSTAQQLTLMNHSFDMIISTSLESLNNLYRIVGTTGKEWLIKQQLLVISSPMVDRALELGFLIRPVLAKNASDQAIVEALLLHCSAG